MPVEKGSGRGRKVVYRVVCDGLMRDWIVISGGGGGRAVVGEGV